MEIHFNNKFLAKIHNGQCLTTVLNHLGLDPNKYYLISNGKRLNHDDFATVNKVEVIPRVFGGKGGFGSMLRAIGAQIEKTTNREACRDLSGRRLRDINEEKRLKNWISAQAEREKEAAQRKQKKLEKLCEEPRHEFKDESYDKLRSILPEQVEDAVTQGLKASCSTKRKSDVENKKKKKKAKLWIDEEIDSSDASCDDDSAENSKAANSQDNSDSKDSEISSSVEKEKTEISKHDN